MWKPSQHFVERVILLLLSSYILYFVSLKILDNNIDISEGTNKILAKIDKTLTLNQYEKKIVSSIIFPDSITDSFSTIGGLDDIKSILHKSLFKPIKIKSKDILLKPPNGIILYGPPGTGKTLLAKAIASEMNGSFISCDPSVFQNQYYGESSKLIKAIFSLANKLSPSIIFIDELDGILSTRSTLDQSPINESKTLFLSQMDGILSRNPEVIVIGTTNKLQHIDDAIRRRMRLHIHVPLPDYISRGNIFDLLLNKYNIDDISEIQKNTEGFSGSDIFELCKMAGTEALYNDRTNIIKDDLLYALEHF